MSGKRRAGRLGLGAAAGLVFIALTADTALWWFTTSRLATQAQSWRQARIAEGYAVASGAPARGGWPLRAELTVPDLVLATGKPGASGTATWRAEAVRLVLSPWQPSLLTVLVQGEQSVQLGSAPAVKLDAAVLSLAVPLDDAGQQAGVTLTGRKLGWNTQAGTAGVDELWLRLLPLHAQLAITGVSLPGRAMPFGGTADTLSLQADATAPLPPGTDIAAAAAAWRDAGGRVVVSHMALRWGPLDVTGQVTLGLDAALQPDGAGTLHLAGYQQAIEALVRSGAITRNDARVAGTLLSLVSTSASDGAPEADVPIELHRGTVSVGAFPLLRIPALAFP